MQSDICIIGAGPAGLMAAICAAREGASVTLLEANGAPGRKLLVTGGGRCNITHDATIDEFVQVFGRAGRFMRHCLYEMSPDDVRTFFHDRQLPTVVEPDGCVFPSEGRAVDVREILRHEAEQSRVHLLCDRRVRSIVRNDAGFAVTTTSEALAAQSVIITTGGVSWPQTGSTGDGYRFAKALGHTVVRPKAALVPIVTRESWPSNLAGVAVSDVCIRAASNPKKTASRGAVVFTQDGIGGPAAQDMSRLLADELADRHRNIGLLIDLAPLVREEELDVRLQQLLVANARKAVGNVLTELVPRRLAAMLCTLAKCDGELQASQLKKDDRKAILSSLKSLPLHARGTRPIEEATVTSGGIDTREIDSKTMASKIRPGLFFAGEVLDVDGPCGGYNLQMCFSTGAQAGRSAARYLAGL